MQGLAYPFEDGIYAEACIVKSHLQPVEPEEREEADIGFDRCLVVKICRFKCEGGIVDILVGSSML